MKTSWQPDISAADAQYLGPTLFKIFVNRMECTLRVSMGGPKVGGVEGMCKYHWAAVQRVLNRPEEWVEVPHAELHQKQADSIVTGQ